MSHQYRYKQIACLLATAALSSACGSVFASAFQLMEQNVTNLGTAYAGTASLAIDASTGFYNSAGLTRICEEQVALSAIGLKVHSRLRIDSARDTIGNLVPGVPGVVNSQDQALIPGLHYAARLDDCWVFGLNVVTPFGLQSTYYESSQVRYMGTRSELRTYDIAPSLAYCFGSGFSIGAGPDFLYGFAAIDQNLRLPLPVRGTPSEATISNRLAGWGVGGHFGALFEISDCTRVGINYRSPIMVKARGTSQFISDRLGLNTIDEVRSTITFPDTVVASVFHQFDDCWAIMADAQWTNWNRFKELRVDNVVRNSTVIQTHNFRSTWRFAVGTSYQFDECFLGRFGVAYDRSPVRDNLRTTRIPDADRTWVAIGARYNITPCLAIDAGYAHLFFKNARINQRADTRVGTPGFVESGEQLQGNYKTGVSILGLQLTWDIA